MENPDAGHEVNFMTVFKYYKSNKSKPSLQDVILVDHYQNKDKVMKVVSTRTNQNDDRTSLLGLNDFSSWQLYTFHDHPGLFLIRNPFTSLGQRYWIRQCLETYPKKPNITNIDTEMVIQDWWRECYVSGECNQQLMKKLRWSTLGYHHNWDTKEYSEDNRTEFPADLAELSDVVANFLGYRQFKAEAAIVNYYHMKSTLSAHTDHSEINLQAPLFSISFGQSAIFLIGGPDKSQVPTAVLLQSGDIMVMSKQARLCYHAVPKILPASSASWNDNINTLTSIEIPSMNYYSMNCPKELMSSMNKNADNVEWCKFSNYVEGSRINMNVRQVLNENQTSLADPVFIENS